MPRARHGRLVAIVTQMLELHARHAAEAIPQEQTALQRRSAQTARQIDRTDRPDRPPGHECPGYQTAPHQWGLTVGCRRVSRIHPALPGSPAIDRRAMLAWASNRRGDDMNFKVLKTEAETGQTART